VSHKPTINTSKLTFYSNERKKVHQDEKIERTSNYLTNLMNAINWITTSPTR
jgi:hypothetical protein